MSNAAKHLGKEPFMVELDNEITALPGRSLRSILEVFTHLEALASRQERDSHFAAEHENPVESLHLFAKGQPPPAEHGGIDFRELGRRVIAAARAQVRGLQARTQEVQSLVLINDWRVAEKLWCALLAECKTPLFELNFLEELWGVQPDRLEVNGWSLTQQWHHFVLIQAEIEIVLAHRQNLLELSNSLERHLGAWLRRFGELLERLDEHSLA